MKVGQFHLCLRYHVIIIFVSSIFEFNMQIVLAFLKLMKILLSGNISTLQIWFEAT
jgi:hypothetical protein